MTRCSGHLVIGVDAVLSALVGGVAVDPAVLVAPHHAEVLEDVQHLGHLCEDEDTVPLVEELLEKLVQQHHLDGPNRTNRARESRATEREGESAVKMMKRRRTGFQHRLYYLVFLWYTDS